MTQGREFQPPHHRDWLAILIACLAYIVMAVMLSGCTTTKYVPVKVPQTHTDTLWFMHERHDSIWLHDSIYQREYMRGDTVYRYIDRWHNQYIKQFLRDTTYISRRDTVPVYISRRDTVKVPCPVEKRVPAQLSWHQQARLWIGNIVLVALAVAAAVWIVRERKWWLAIIRKIIKHI